jgi:hypothetical protein
MYLSLPIREESNKVGIATCEGSLGLEVVQVLGRAVCLDN